MKLTDLQEYISDEQFESIKQAILDVWKKEAIKCIDRKIEKTDFDLLDWHAGEETSREPTDDEMGEAILNDVIKQLTMETVKRGNINYTGMIKTIGDKYYVLNELFDYELDKDLVEPIIEDLYSFMCDNLSDRARMYNKVV